jgi:hypothetical protein
MNTGSARLRRRTGGGVTRCTAVEADIGRAGCGSGTGVGATTAGGAVGRATATVGSSG